MLYAHALKSSFKVKGGFHERELRHSQIMGFHVTQQEFAGSIAISESYPSNMEGLGYQAWESCWR